MSLPLAESHDPAPVLVEVTRGGLVESQHRGAYAVVDAAGRVLRSAGDIERPVFARSAIKPLQALPLLETGAADKYGLSDAEIALACSSHHGEPIHVAQVGHWLLRIGLGPDNLECGAHLPYSVAASHELIRRDQAPSTLHHNCSGKHSGFVCTAKSCGEPVAGYIEWEHPVQQRVQRALGEMVGQDLTRAPRGRDGCGIPVIGVGVHGWARGMARLADPSGLPAERAEAAKRILAAMAAAPLMVEGTAGMTTTIMERAGAQVRLKPGAEGVFCAALPLLGLGIALKIEDGAKRAAEVAMALLLDALDCFGPEQQQALAPFLSPRIFNVAGIEVGVLRAGPALRF